MRVLLLRASFGLLLVAGFSTSNSCSAESHCPDGVPSLHPRIVAGALLVVPVRINHLGPFDFMVDTGSQLNVIDPSLAARLSLKSQGTVGLIATNSYSRATVALLESLETGPYTVEKPLVVVQDLGSVQGADPLIRGVLGEDFCLTSMSFLTTMGIAARGYKPANPPPHGLTFIWLLTNATVRYCGRSLRGLIGVRLSNPFRLSLGSLSY
jgi:hypothetical protein